MVPRYDVPSLTRTNNFDEQSCAVGIWNQDTLRLEENPECPPSHELLHMSRPPTNKTLTFLLLHYNDNFDLANQLHEWRTFSQSALNSIQFLIVDDGSAPQHSAAHVLQANREIAKHFDILVYRIDQNLQWNIGGARNLRFWMADTPWVFMNDADIQVKPETMDFVNQLVTESRNRTDPQHVYLYFQRYRGDSRYKPHPAIMLLRRQDYWRLGGCDEDFVGHYGQTDVHFRLKIERSPNVQGLEIHKRMSKENVPALVQRNGDSVCPSEMNCLIQYKGPTPNRDTAHNEKLYAKKVEVGRWSTKCSRFTWKRIT